MNKIFVLIFLVCTDLLYGQQIIKNLKWLNVEQEISELAEDKGVTLYAETQNIQNNEIVQITIWETGDETDYLIGQHISRVEENRVSFHWILDFNLERSKIKSDMYENGYTVQYYFNIQYDKILSHNSGLLDVLWWSKTRIAFEGTDDYLINKKYTVVLADLTQIEGWTDAEGYINIENKIWGETFFYMHDETEEYHEVELAYKEPEKPVYYQVRKNDSLWKIASYDFIYGNPYLWQNIYKINKNNFIDEKNPDLIEVGQTLLILPHNDEIRGGTRSQERFLRQRAFVPQEP
jgi:hypothetical protein